MGNNHLQWYDASKRKVLILSFEDSYLKKFQKLSNVDVEINDA